MLGDTEIADGIAECHGNVAQNLNRLLHVSSSFDGHLRKARALSAPGSMMHV
jgi:hypothetical protein